MGAELTIEQLDKEWTKLILEAKNLGIEKGGSSAVSSYEKGPPVLKLLT